MVDNRGGLERNLETGTLGVFSAPCLIFCIFGILGLEETGGLDLDLDSDSRRERERDDMMFHKDQVLKKTGCLGYGNYERGEKKTPGEEEEERRGGEWKRREVCARITKKNSK